MCLFLENIKSSTKSYHWMRVFNSILIFKCNVSKCLTDPLKVSSCVCHDLIWFFASCFRGVNTFKCVTSRTVGTCQSTSHVDFTRVFLSCSTDEWICVSQAWWLKLRLAVCLRKNWDSCVLHESIAEMNYDEMKASFKMFHWHLSMQLPFKTSFPQPVVTQSSLGDETDSASSKQIGPMCESYLMSFSKYSRAMSFWSVCGWYCGWKTILWTRTIWNGFGSSSLPKRHSPALIKTSLCRWLQKINS